jgi:hypothetical protein
MEHERPVVELDVEFVCQSVKPSQPDVAPGSYVVVPDDEGDGRVERLEWRQSLIERHSKFLVAMGWKYL